MKKMYQAQKFKICRFISDGSPFLYKITTPSLVYSTQEKEREVIECFDDEMRESKAIHHYECSLPAN